MEDMEKSTVKEMIEWMTDKGHTEEEIMECIRRMVGAKQRDTEKENKK